MRQDQNSAWNADQANGIAAGLNDNVEFAGKQLHVQTESIGTPTSCVVTQIFSNGRVLFSKKTECLQGLNELQNLMRDQHAQVLRDLAEKEAKILGDSRQRGRNS